MTNEIIFVLLDDFANWEGAFLAPALRTGVMPGRKGSHAVKYLTPGGRTFMRQPSAEDDDKSRCPEP